MRAWFLLLVSFVVVIAACSSDGRAPAARSIGATTSAAPDAPRVKPPADVGPRAAVHPFVTSSDGLVTSGSTYESRVTRDGAFEVTPRTTPTAPGPFAATRGTPLSVATIAIRRGERDVDIRGVATIEEDGAVVVRRNTVLERIENEGTGIEQSWRFERAPIGEGDLVVRVAVSGEAYRRATDQGLHFDGDGLGVRYGTATWVDARGDRVTIVPHFTGGAIELVVPADVVERSAFPAVLDPTITPEREIDQPAAVSSAPGEQGAPAMASLGPGQGYFAVWHDRRSVRPAFVGTRISSSGTVIDQTGLTLVSGVATTTPPPSLFASANGLLLVWSVSNFNQWQTPGIYALRIDKSGTALDGQPIAVAKNIPNLPTPTAAFDGTNWLISWYKYNPSAQAYEFLGVRVSAEGTVVDPTPVAIYSSKTYAYAPELVFDGSGFLLTYNANNAIRAQRVGADAKAVGPPVPLISATSVYDYTIVFDGTNHHLAWFEYIGGVTTYQLSARRFDKQGAPAGGGASTVLPTNQYVQNLRSAWDGTNVVFTWYASSLGIQGARVSPSGALVDQTAQVLHSTTSFLSDYAFASDGPGGIVAFREFSGAAGTGNDVSGVKVTASGGGLSGGKSFVVSNASNSETDPATAWNGSTYFTVWLDTREAKQTLWGAPIAADGTPGPAVKVLSNPNGAINYSNISAPRIASNGTTFFVTFAANQSGCTTPCPFRSLFGLVVDAKGAVQGTVVDLLPSVSGSGTTQPQAPDVAFDGTNYLVVYEDQTDGFGIAGRRVKSDGTALDDKTLRISPVTPGFSENRRAPSIAFDGTRYFVAWQTTRPSANNVAVGHIYGTRVEKEGAPLDGELTICNAFLLQAAPRVAGDPKNGFFVVWDDYRTSLDAADVYGGRVSPEGQLLDGDKGRALSTNETDESRPTVTASGDGTGWIVVWRDLRSKQAYDVYGAWVSAAGANRDPNGFLFSSEGGDEETPVLRAGPSGKLLLTYARLDPRTGYGSYRLRARAVDAGKPVGQACANGDECASRACVDGFCCSNDCEGCGTCSATPGTCTPRAAGSSSPRCGYRCKGTLECPTECLENSDCADGATCDTASKKCVTRQICIDAKTLQDLTGKQTDCAPYTCVGDTCRTSCVSVDDCAAGFVCDLSGRCVPPPNGGDVSACAVPGATGSRRGSSAAFVLIGIAGAIASSRRRRAR